MTARSPALAAGIAPAPRRTATDASTCDVIGSPSAPRYTGLDGSAFMNPTTTLVPGGYMGVAVSIPGIGGTLVSGGTGEPGSVGVASMLDPVDASTVYSHIPE